MRSSPCSRLSLAAICAFMLEPCANVTLLPVLMIGRKGLTKRRLPAFSMSARRGSSLAVPWSEQALDVVAEGPGRAQ